MMYKQIAFIVLALAAGCNKTGDLEQVCSAFTQLAAEPKLATMDSSARMDFVNGRVAQSVGRFSQVNDLWELIPNYESEARYRMFRRTAEELLGRPWQCPDMERLASTLSEPMPEPSR
jgi:hypothetical protein